MLHIHWLLIYLLPLVSAGGTGPRNWGVPKNLRQAASTTERQACGEAGSFFVEVGGKTLCSSSKTREALQSLSCPIWWSKHRTTGSCLPPSEISEADCGEGYNWVGNGKTCAPSTGKDGDKGCNKGQWYHSGSKSCIDNLWSTNPPSGKCDKGKSCPKGWFWHAELKQCKPGKKRSPKPDCNDWNDREQCCGGHHPPGPSASVRRGGGHGDGQGGGYGDHGGNGHNNKGHGGHKRTIKQDQNLIAGDTFKQSVLDKLYCPKSLHCSINTRSGDEWAYECVDFATELESCGGCADMGEGQDCTAIPFAKSVGCEAGVCTVYSCKGGLRSNGTACIE